MEDIWKTLTQDYRIKGSMGFDDKPFWFIVSASRNSKSNSNSRTSIVRAMAIFTTLFIFCLASSMVAKANNITIDSVSFSKSDSLIVGDTIDYTVYYSLDSADTTSLIMYTVGSGLKLINNGTIDSILVETNFLDSGNYTKIYQMFVNSTDSSNFVFYLGNSNIANFKLNDTRIGLLKQDPIITILKLEDINFDGFFQQQEADCGCNGSITINDYVLQCRPDIEGYRENQWWKLKLYTKRDNGTWNVTILEQGEDAYGEIPLLIPYTINNLCPGTYIVSLTYEPWVIHEDVETEGDLAAYAEITIGGSAGVEATASVDQSICECKASATIEITKGSPPYIIIDCNQSTGGNQISSNTITFNDLCEGHYCKKIIDADGCETTVEFDIDPQEDLTFQYTIDNILCNEPRNSGSITINNIVSDNPANTTLTMNGQPVDISTLPITISNLSGGEYIFILNDNITGCADTITITIIEQFWPNLNYTKIDGCDGALNGSGSIYFENCNQCFMWYKGNQANYDSLMDKSWKYGGAPCEWCGPCSYDNLAPGDYTIYIRSDCGLPNCEDSVHITIKPKPVEFDYVVDISEPEGCDPETQVADVTITFGITPPYTITNCDGSEMNPQPDNTTTTEYTDYDGTYYVVVDMLFNDLPIGHYCFTIVDICDISHNIEFDVLPGGNYLDFSVSFNTIIGPPCYSIATIYPALIHGKPPYTVQWDYDLVPPGTPFQWDGTTPISDEKYSGPPFRHSIKIIDANGCIDTFEGFNNTSCEAGGVIGIVANPALYIVNVTHNIPFSAVVSTVITDLGGNEVIRVNHGFQEQGIISFAIDISELLPGSYYVIGEYNGAPYGTVMILIKQ